MPSLFQTENHQPKKADQLEGKAPKQIVVFPNKVQVGFPIPVSSAQSVAQPTPTYVVDDPPRWRVIDRASG
jgi:hypothetical protein